MTEGEEYNAFPGIVHWNLVFMRGDRTSWWDWLTHPDWRHVCAYGYVVECDRWVIYDVAHRGSFISVVDHHWFDRWCDIRKPNITALVRMPVCASPPDPRARVGLWCVTAIKHLVGLRSGAFRPQALYRDCLLQGGTDVPLRKTDGRQGKTAAGRSRGEGSPRAG